MQKKEMVKIEFRVQDGEGVNVETPWAKRIGKSKFQLDNSPFYAYDVSWEDIIEAVPDEEGVLVFKKVIQKSGNRSVRVIFDPPIDKSEESKKILDGLVDMGCSYEGANPGYICVNIPRGIELMEVRGYLIEQNVEWEHADPSYETLYPDQSK